jgi:hypothetical protein
VFEKSLRKIKQEVATFTLCYLGHKIKYNETRWTYSLQGGANVNAHTFILETWKKPDSKRIKYQDSVAKYTQATANEDVDWKNLASDEVQL